MRINIHSIKFKISVFFFLIILVLVGHLFYSYSNRKKLIVQMRILNILHNMNEDVLQIRRYEKNFILRGGEEWAALWRFYIRGLINKTNQFKDLITDEKKKSAVFGFLDKLQTYVRESESYISRYKDSAYRPEAEIFITLGRQMISFCQELKDESENSIQRYLRRLFVANLFIIFFSLFVTVIVFLFIRKLIINPIINLQLLCRSIERNGSYNPEHIDLLQKSVREVAVRKDEIGRLFMAYQEMVDRCAKSYKICREQLDELQSMYRIKSEFASTVSHELRTPLTAIKEGIELVFDGSAGPLNEEQKEFLGIARRNVDRLTYLVNNVLDFSRLSSKKFEFKNEPVNINEIIESVIDGFQLEANRKNLYLRKLLDNTAGLIINSDADRIAQVLTNLIANAIKFTLQGGIQVYSNKDLGTNMLKICVEDTGIGIKNEDIPKLFQPFVQVGDTKTRKTGGSGLGLAISREIIEQLGGKIWVESEFGKGSKFCFILPIKERRGV